MGHRGGGAYRHVTVEGDMCGVGTGTHWRFSEMEAAVVALSSLRCATARVWKCHANWEVCSRASMSKRERVSAAALNAFSLDRCRIS